MSEFVNVHCKVSNGVVLRTFEKSEGPFGIISFLPKDSVTLNPGNNAVDSKFFDAWMEANSDNDLVKDGFIQRSST